MSGHCSGSRPPDRTDTSCGQDKILNSEAMLPMLMNLHLCLAGIAMIQLRVNILHLIVLILTGN